MTRLSGLSLAILSLTTTTALGGALERGIPRIDPLFEPGRYLEFGVTYASPDLSGNGGAIPPAFGGPAEITGSTGNLLEDYFSFSAAYKSDLSTKQATPFAYALIYDQPFGSDTLYPGADTANPLDAQSVYGDSEATVDSYRLTPVVAYKFGNIAGSETGGARFTVYGGPMIQAADATAAISFLSYDIEADRDWTIGYMLGGAVELPRARARVSLTYRSETAHTFDVTENVGPATFDGDLDVDFPQSLTLDARTGVPLGERGLLVFGQVHWVDWSNFEIAPDNYPVPNRALVSYEEDFVTYTLGVARPFTDNLTGIASVAWEPQTGEELTSLGPIDGRVGLNLGARWENERVRIEGGASYNFLGDAENVLVTDYDDGDAIGFGLRVGFKL